MIVRTSTPALTARAAEDALRRVDASVRPLPAAVSDRVEAYLGGKRMLAWMSAPTAVLALLLAAVGVYGVTAFAVGQRTEEIGVRMASSSRRAERRGAILRACCGRRKGPHLKRREPRSQSGLFRRARPFTCAAPQPLHSAVGKNHASATWTGSISSRQWEATMRRLPIPPSPEFDRLAEGARFRDRIAVPIAASPEAIFEALRAVRLRDFRLAWALGELRYLPVRLRRGRMPPADSKQPFLSLLIAGGTLILRDDSPRELITGSAAALHRMDQTPRRFASREDFDAFADDDCEKLYMSIRVAPTGRAGEHWLVLEHATRALSSSAERRFARYWRIIKPSGAFVTWLLLRAIRRAAERSTAAARRAPGRTTSVRATAAEGLQPLPGDDLLPVASASATHAITIERPPRDVWPWLAQMGAGRRAGWYSYDVLDNGRRRSATRIVPELQVLTPGMIFPALPDASDAFTLLAFEPDRFLILGVRVHGQLIMTWAFVLVPLTAGSCRLVVRARVGAGYAAAGLPIWMTSRLGPAVHFVMQRKQLLGIRRRAESVPPSGLRQAA